MRMQACLFVLGSCALTSAVAAPPVSAFTNFAQIESLKISPDGKLLALTKRSEQAETITVLRYPEGTVVSHRQLGAADIAQFEWATNNRLLIQPARRFANVASKVSTGEIVGMDADGTHVDTLFGYMAGKMQTGSIMEQRQGKLLWASILDMTPEDPRTVLIQTGNYEREGGGGSVQRLDVKTGMLSRVAGSPVEEAVFVTGRNGKLLFVSGRNRKGDYQTWKFRPADQGWDMVASSAPNEGRVWPFEETDNPDEFIALDSVQTATDSVVVWNVKTQERRPLFKNDHVDVYTGGFDRSRHAWVYHYDDHFPEYWYPDPEHRLARAHRMLRASFKDAHVWFTSSTTDESLVVAEVDAPRIPPMFSSST